MIRLLACITATALLCGYTYRPKDDPYELDAVVSAMMFTGVETTYSWKDCGVVNAYYQPTTRHVTLCNELRALPPGVIRYIAAHELAHGVIAQRNLGFTGSSEWAADELSSLVLLLIGHDLDVEAGAAFWLERASAEDPFDEHLGDERRGFGMLCMVASKKAGQDVWGCDIQYRHVVHAWNVLLGLDRE